MSPNQDAFRRFQDELAALDRQKAAAGSPEQRMARARNEFLQLRERYQLSIADVVTFFPEEEGIAYLQQLIASAEAKPKRGRKRST